LVFASLQIQKNSGKCYRIASQGELKSRYSHNSAGYLAIGDDGLVYSGAGEIFDPSGAAAGPFADIPSVGKVEGMSLIPGIGGLFFLGVNDQGMLRVFQSGVPSPAPLGLIGRFPEWDSPRVVDNPRPDLSGGHKQLPGMWRDEQWSLTPLTFDRRVLFAPGDGYLVFLPRSGKTLIRRPFLFKPFLDSTEKDYLLVKNRASLRVRTGQVWTYAIDVVARYEPVTFRLEKSPEGMTLSPKGVLNWRVPAGIEGRARVVVAISDTKANTIRHRFEIAFD
jgi:hypothetical protein